MTSTARVFARVFITAGSLMVGVGAADAQTAATKTYPTRPIRLIVPQSPGGPSDTIARVAAQKLGDLLGQPVVADNRAGAAGNVGCELAAKAAPDGYTLLLGPPGCLTINPSLYEKLAFDPLRDFAPITQLTSGPEMLVVHPSVAAQSVKELVALAKAKPGAFNFASGGAGTPNHLASELFKNAAGLQMVHVPYKGTGPALTAVMSGQVQMMMAGLPPALPQVKAGKLRALGVTSAKRSRVVPEIPTIAESGFPGFDIVSWHSILAPAKTPRPIVMLLNAELVKMLAQPDVKERFASLGLDTVGSTPEEFREHLKRETANFSKLIKTAGIKPD
ncbi:MAG TPA: tripartite tricarboxylate transporter substrate binding protein [Burkholderiales bacterium]|jgi:tripartite-type tricarboxylate transporter receptor subunit TctC|nr:tripartite tricarboxylate transporter substrate binding protein [Burkholderiales bacterium]